MARRTRDLLTLLTDFGLADYYVAAVKGVVLGLAPQTRLLDVSHDVPAGDVAAGAFVLGAALPYLPAGAVHLAVVDPGVGSERRILAARAGDALLVSPDNGLLPAALERAGWSAGAELFAAERPDLYRGGPGETFHGRDRFAPLAAALLLGTPLEELGPRAEDAVVLPGEPPSRRETELRGRVIHVDRFGNLVTDVPSGWLADPRSFGHAEIGGLRLDRFGTHYRQLPADQPGILPGSAGTLEASLRDGNLAKHGQLGPGAPVRIYLR